MVECFLEKVCVVRRTSPESLYQDAGPVEVRLWDTLESGHTDTGVKTRRRRLFQWRY